MKNCLRAERSPDQGVGDLQQERKKHQTSHTLYEKM
jgi:hypothetical protein